MVVVEIRVCFGNDYEINRLDALLRGRKLRERWWLFGMENGELGYRRS